MADLSRALPLSTFISYAHEDEALREELVNGLGQLQRQGLIQIWDDQRILAGDDWSGDIDEQLTKADIILLLVSPDFLASGYCYERELPVALARHAKRQARVIPIIVRNCDWQNSPLNALQALPRNGIPVVNWTDRDKAFLDIAKGLRRAIASRSDGFSRVALPSIAERAWLSRWRRALIGATAVLVLFASVAWWSWSSASALIRDGNDFMDVGRYADALKFFEKALTTNPLSKAARLGADIAHLADLRDPVLFEQQLHVLQKAAPGNPYLKVLEGDYYYGVAVDDDDLSKAESAYQEAAQRNPGFAEAWFRLGVLYDRQGRQLESIDMYKRALQRSRVLPQYRSNLADLYFQRGEYEEAIAQYDQITTFPLAALENARIQLLLNRMSEATALQLRAISTLEDPGAESAPENRAPWYFKIGKDTGVRLTDLNEKLCFARLNLAATLFVRRDSTAERRFESAASTCGEGAVEIKALVRDHLGRLAEEQRQFSSRVAEFINKYLPE